MPSLTPFLTLLTEIEDPRRAEGKLYRLPHVLLFAILAMLAGANSYRAIHSFIDVHLARLRDFFALPWRRAPAYTTIRFILQQLDTASVEEVFRRHAAILHAQTCPAGERHVALDGKALRHSFDHFQDRKAAHILNAFACDAALVLAHLDCDEKSNEIPAVQALLAELGLAGAVVTVDAMHCQKNSRTGRRDRGPADRPGQGQPTHPAPARRTGMHGASPRGSAHDPRSQPALA
jgi:hypothetical protein